MDLHVIDVSQCGAVAHSNGDFALGTSGRDGDMTMKFSGGLASPTDSATRGARSSRSLVRMIVGTALVTTALIGGVGVSGASASAPTSHDSLGTDFWLGFPTNYTTVPSLSLFISGPTATTGSVDVPGLAFTSPFSVAPGTVTTVALPAGAVINNPDVVESLGIHVTANAEVTVYGLNQIAGSTDAYLGLPTDVLGTEYLVLGYSGNLGAEFAVVASQNATTVTVTPSATVGSHLAGVPYSVAMDQGQTYQLNATELTGTVVGADKPIAVFAGNRCAVIPSGSCDHVVEQMTPTNTWGTSFVSVPLATRPFDRFRYLAGADGTNVNVDGILVATLNRGQFYEDARSGAFTITSDKPILVAQYANSGAGLSSTNGDPFEVLVPPSDQFLDSYTVATPAVGFSKHYINVVAPTASIGTIVRDGTTVPAASFTAIGVSGFSGAQLLVTAGSHTLTGSQPFGITVYGWGGFDAYGYPGGISFPSVAPVATTLTLAPKTASNPVDTQDCVTATVRDQANAPMSGVSVAFSVTGGNSTSGSGSTATDGTAQFCYTGTIAGDDAILAAAGTLTDTATKQWTFTSVVTTLTLAPKTATNPVNTQHCVTATVKDQVNSPMSGVSVAFTVTGVNPTSGSVSTVADGTAQFCYTGTIGGQDSIQAAAGSVSDTATKDWTTLRTISALGSAHAWIGLRNSDDQGTQYDVRVELLKNGVPVASGLTRCITGVTRAPGQAKDAIIPWNAFAAVPVAPGDVLSVQFSARIGTNSNDTKCAGPSGSHNSAAGLRLYYDASKSNSQFAATIGVNPSATLFLDSDGAVCNNAESPGVTGRYLVSAAATAGAARCKDAGTVNFANGNKWSIIGTWSLAPLT